MPSKVRVYGKAQNRTALGIVNAYLVMYPHATKEDLEKVINENIEITKELIDVDKNILDNYNSLLKNNNEDKKNIYL